MTSRSQKLVALARSRQSTSLEQREQLETLFQPPVENASNFENPDTDIEFHIENDINLPVMSDGKLNIMDIPIIFDFIDDMSSNIENAPNFENNTDTNDVEEITADINTTPIEKGNENSFIFPDQTNPRSENETEINELSQVLPSQVEPSEEGRSARIAKDLDTINKNNREKGLGYRGWEKHSDGKYKRGGIKSPRKQRAACNSNMCITSKKRYCTEFTQEEREAIFKKFWSLTWSQKKLFLTSLTRKFGTKTKVSDDSRRHATLVYSLKKPTGETLQVCKQMFLGTLGIKETYFYRIMRNQAFGMNNNQLSLSQSTVTKNGQRNVAQRECLTTFFNQLPKLPSHYCRKSSNKLYLEPFFPTVQSVYNEYKKFCSEKNSNPLGRKVFLNMMTKEKIGLHTPKKDRCNTCISYEQKHIDEDTYSTHIQRKDRAREEKNTDKNLALEGKATVLVMDLQAVKLCPMLNASALYYKTKLACHNFTVYNMATKHVKCYWWDETKVNLCSSTFASCIINYILTHVTDYSIPIILWSDGCSYQNKNAVMANALLSLSKEKNVEIFQKYLEVGHTQMEVDSVHATIERRLKNNFIHLPSDYWRVTRMARQNPPYEVHAVDHGFIRDYDCNLKYTSIRPGTKAGDPTVNNIKSLLYIPSGIIKFKLNFDDEFVELPEKRGMNKKDVPLLTSFNPSNVKPINISHEKYNHLQQLKAVIPADVHSFYDDLPHK